MSEAVMQVLGIPLVLSAVLVGAYAAAVTESVVAAVTAGRSVAVSAALLNPVRRTALLLRQTTVITERPDSVGWVAATTGYVTLAVLAAGLIPLSAGTALTDFSAGIVVWGALEAMVIVMVFLRGWAPNSFFSMVGGYRFVIQAFSFELLSMFVLIAAALPARSLNISEIVLAQQGILNLIKQPLGLPLWIVVTLGITFKGPANLSDGRDLATGTSAESSGRDRLLWEIGRMAMLIVFSAMGATVFLGGWLGPWLPGSVWLVLKTLLVALIALAVAAAYGRLRPEGFVAASWTVLLPLAFIHLFQAGVVALL